MRAVVFDLDGVIYDSETPIEGAAEAVAWVQSQSIPHLFLTNTTSLPRQAIAERLLRMGVSTDSRHILTPAWAAARWLRLHSPGPAALFVTEATRDEFADIPIIDREDGPVGAVVVGDLGEEWDFATMTRAFRLLMREPRPILLALGMTRYWKAPDGLRLDVGASVAALQYASGLPPLVMGKPAAPYFAEAISLLGVEAGSTVMIGDDIRGDIEGGSAAGMRTLLVRTGKFRESDLGLGITPDGILDSVARFPGWWREQMGR